MLLMLLLLRLRLSSAAVAVGAADEALSPLLDAVEVPPPREDDDGTRHTEPSFSRAS